MAVALKGKRIEMSGRPAGESELFPAEASIDRSRPIGEQVYGLLRRAITHWRLSPGDPIPETVVTKRFNVSRSPLREAFRQLASDGLVDVRPQAGTFVSPVDRPRWEEGRAIRRALEIEGIRRAALRIDARQIDELELLMMQQRRAVAEEDFERLLDLDDRFHAHICDLSGFPRLWRMIHGAKAQIDRTRYMALPAMGRADATIEEHQAIVDALAARDATASIDRLVQHLDSSDASMVLLFEGGELE